MYYDLVKIVVKVKKTATLGFNKFVRNPWRKQEVCSFSLFKDRSFVSKFSLFLTAKRALIPIYIK